MNDETYAACLRAAVRPDTLASDLNPHAVLRSARHSRTRLAVARSAGAVAVSIGVIVGSGHVIDSTWLARGVPPDGQENMASAPSVVEVAPGVRATSRPGARPLADGTRAILLGLIGRNVSTDGHEIAVVPNDGVNAASVTEAPWRDNAFEIALLAGDAVAQRQYWDAWASDAPLTEREREYWTVDGASGRGDDHLMAGQPPALAPDEGWAMAWPFDDGTWFIVGYMPSGTDQGLRARVPLREPISVPGGRNIAALDLPIFDAGSSDGSRMFAATISADVGLPIPTRDEPSTVLERVPVVTVPPAG